MVNLMVKELKLGMMVENMMECGEMVSQ
jgi:hypothetical protein